MTPTAKRYVPPGALTLAETARRLNLKYISHVHNLHNAGEIQAWRLGRSWWVVESSVVTYLEKTKGEQGHGSGDSAWR